MCRLPIERPHVCLMVYSNRSHIRQPRACTVTVGKVWQKRHMPKLCSTLSPTILSGPVLGFWKRLGLCTILYMAYGQVITAWYRSNHYCIARLLWPWWAGTGMEMGPYSYIIICSDAEVWFKLQSGSSASWPEPEPELLLGYLGLNWNQDWTNRTSSSSLVLVWFWFKLRTGGSEFFQ